MMPIEPPDEPPRASGEAVLDRDEFERQVQDALAHAQDPVYLQTHPLARFVRLELGASDSSHAVSPTARRSSHSPSIGRALSQALLDTIGALCPSSASPEGPPLSRAHQILRLRYVDALEVSDVLDRLAISRSAYYVEHQRAVRAVAAQLWDRWIGGQRSSPSRSAPEPLLREKPPLHNLTLQLTSFVGREREMAEVKRLLQTTRLLTLTGTGGCGKTRLAYQAAVDLLDVYPDGVWVVELASLSDPELVPQTIAFSLGVREPFGKPIRTALVDYLKPRHLLIVLDNCEHLLDACAVLAEALLRACPEVQVLATSRQVLGILGETSFLVPPLSLPDLHHLPSTGDPAACESVRLFVDRATAVRPAFALTSENGLAVAQICCWLDGIPLAIELAAARVRALSVEQIASRLDDRLQLLTGGSRTALPRQQTLRATIDWSYDLLSEPERVLFRRLAVFSGGIVLEAAEAVCSGDDLAANQVLAPLSQLVDKSLVLAEEAGREVRYRLLDTIREYARGALHEAGEVPEVRRRHRDWFLALAEAAEVGLQTSQHVAWIERLEREHDNLRSALQYSLEADPEAGLRLAGSLFRLWRERGYFDEGSRWLESFLASTSAPTSARAWALDSLATLAFERGDTLRGKPLIEASLALFRELGDDPGVVRALRDRVGFGIILGDDPEYLCRLTEESLALARRIGDRLGEGFGYVFLGRVAATRRDYERGLELARRGLPIIREVGDTWRVGQVLWDVGWLCLLAQSIREGREAFDELFGIAQQIGDRQFAGLALTGLAMVAQAEDELMSARLLLLDAIRQLTMTTSGGIHDAIAESGHLLVQVGEHAVGIRLLAAGEQGTARRGSWQRFYEDAARRRWSASKAAARIALGDEAFARAWAEGQAMTLEQAVEYALTESSARY